MDKDVCVSLFLQAVYTWAAEADCSVLANTAILILIEGCKTVSNDFLEPHYYWKTVVKSESDPKLSVYAHNKSSKMSFFAEVY